MAVTGVLFLAVGLYTQGPPGDEAVIPTSAGPSTAIVTGNTDPAQTNAESVQTNTGSTVHVALATAGSGTIVSFADQVLDELNLMQLEMTAASEIEQLDQLETIMEELTSFGSSSDDG